MSVLKLVDGRILVFNNMMYANQIYVVVAFKIKGVALLVVW